MSTTSIPLGWRWIDANDNDNSVLTYLRYGKDENAPLVVACNFTPVPRRGLSGWSAVRRPLARGA